MKSNATFQFSQDDGTNINTCGYDETVLLEQTAPTLWSAQSNSETPGKKTLIELTVEDARELAANLIRAADFADEVSDTNKLKQRR